MKPYLALLILFPFLAGCSMEKVKTPQANNDKFRITLLFEKRMDAVWTTPYRPWADNYGFIFILADGREMRVSGDVIIEQIK